MSTLLKYLQPLPFCRLMDMGCGTGEFLVELGCLKRQACFVGVDVEENALAKAYSRLRVAQLTSRVSLACGDCSHVPLAAGSADVIVFRGLLHHIQEVGLALAEAHRVLHRDGLLVLQDGKRVSAALFREMNEELGRSGLPEEIHPGFDLGGLSAEVSEYGLRVEDIVEGGVAVLATPPHTSRVYSTGLFCLSARKV